MPALPLHTLVASMPKLPLRAMSGSMALAQLGSGLISMGHVITWDHKKAGTGGLGTGELVLPYNDYLRESCSHFLGELPGEL